MVKPTRKTGLILGGGGVTAGMFEAGAALALDDMMQDISINELDLYTGISAGSLMSSCLATGIPPQELIKSASRYFKSSYFIDDAILFKPDLETIGRTLGQLPYKLAKLNYMVFDKFVLQHYRNRFNTEKGSPDLSDIITEAISILPKGTFLMDNLESYTRRVFTEHGRTNNFDELDCDLLLTATDGNTGNRVVFAPSRYANVKYKSDIVITDATITEAVTASCNLPLIYRPRNIRGQYLIDGGIANTVNLMTSIHYSNTEFHIIMNPLKPTHEYELRGILDYAIQIIKIIAKRNLENSLEVLNKQKGSAEELLESEELVEILDRYRGEDPGLQRAYEIALSKYEKRKEMSKIDYILVEPDRDCQIMHGNLMSFSKAMRSAKIGYEKMVRKVNENYGDYKEQFRSIGTELRMGTVLMRDGELERAKSDKDIIKVLTKHF